MAPSIVSAATRGEVATTRSAVAATLRDGATTHGAGVTMCRDLPTIDDDRTTNLVVAGTIGGANAAPVRKLAQSIGAFDFVANAMLLSANFSRSHIGSERLLHVLGQLLAGTTGF